MSRKARPATVGAAPKRASAYPVPYALETDWPVGAAGFEPLHLHFERDPIPYALETDWPLGAQDSNLRILESVFGQTLSPEARTSNFRISNRAALLTNLSDARSTPTSH